MTWRNSNANDMVGKVFTKVEKTQGTYDDQIVFTVNEHEFFKMYHEQDCCESVGIEEIIGDLEDLVGVPILVAEERSEYNPGDGEGTWTFYEFRTIKGSVTIRWYGTSNGYYSETADICHWSASNP